MQRDFATPVALGLIVALTAVVVVVVHRKSLLQRLVANENHTVAPSSCEDSAKPTQHSVVIPDAPAIQSTCDTNANDLARPSKASSKMKMSGNTKRAFSNASDKFSNIVRIVRGSATGATI